MSTLAASLPGSGAFALMVRPRKTTTVVSGSLTRALFLLGLAPTSNGFPVPVQQSATSAAPPLVIDPRPAVPSIAEAVLEMRRISGLTWDEVAGLFGVTRRAIHHWANGSSLKPEHIRQVHEVLRVIRLTAWPSTEETRSALLTPLAAGQTPVELLKAQDFEGVIASLGTNNRPAFAVPRRQTSSPHPPNPSAFLSGLHDRPLKPAASSGVAKTVRPSRKLDPR